MRVKCIPGHETPLHATVKAPRILSVPCRGSLYFQIIKVAVGCPILKGWKIYHTMKLLY